MSTRPLILISNDDGVQAQGIHELTRMMQELGDVIVVAPSGPRSGAACSITPITPVRLQKEQESEGLTVYSCSGTPTDCVKLALERVVPRKPDLVVSGVNHGDNGSVSLHYSGTMGAVMEACMKGVPAIGYSLKTSDKLCDFTPYEEVVKRVANYVLENGLQPDVCLNVNFPQVSQLKGVNVCRMARGIWQSEWKETSEADTYQLTGYFTNLEPDAQDTDMWALAHGHASIVPLQLDMTCYELIDKMKSLQQ